MSDSYTPRLRTKYRDEIREKLKEKFGYANVMQIPRLDKVVINMGVGEAAQDSKKIKGALEDLLSEAHRFRGAQEPEQGARVRGFPLGSRAGSKLGPLGILEPDRSDRAAIVGGVRIDCHARALARDQNEARHGLAARHREPVGRGDVRRRPACTGEACPVR